MCVLGSWCRGPLGTCTAVQWSSDWPGSGAPNVECKRAHPVQPWGSGSLIPHCHLPGTIVEKAIPCPGWTLAFLVPKAEPAGKLCPKWRASLLHGTLCLVVSHSSPPPGLLFLTPTLRLKLRVPEGGSCNFYQKGLFQKQMYIYINRCPV